MVRTSRPRKVPGTAKQSSDPNLRSGYELHFSIEPGGGRRDCHFTYGTLDQIFFLLREEFRREKDGSGGPASIDEDRSLLAFDGDQATALDLAGFRRTPTSTSSAPRGRGSCSRTTPSPRGTTSSRGGSATP